MQFHFGDYCYGIGHGLLFILLSILYFIIFIISVSISIYSYFKKQQVFNFIPLIITIVTILVLTLAFNSEWLDSPKKFTAGNGFMGSTLSIKENNTFEIKIQGHHMSCHYKGDYKINKDTLELLRKDIGTQTDNIFFNKYLLKGKNLSPIEGNLIVNDSAKSLIINKIYE